MALNDLSSGVSCIASPHQPQTFQLSFISWQEPRLSSPDLPSPCRQRRLLFIPRSRGAGRPGPLQAGGLVAEAQSVPRSHRQEVPLRQEKHQGPLLSDPPACLLCLRCHDGGFIGACHRWDVLLLLVCVMVLVLPPRWASRMNGINSHSQVKAIKIWQVQWATMMLNLLNYYTYCTLLHVNAVYSHLSLCIAKWYPAKWHLDSFIVTIEPLSWVQSRVVFLPNHHCDGNTVWPVILIGINHHKNTYPSISMWCKCSPIGPQLYTLMSCSQSACHWYLVWFIVFYLFIKQSCE